MPIKLHKVAAITAKSVRSRLYLNFVSYFLLTRVKMHTCVFSNACVKYGHRMFRFFIPNQAGQKAAKEEHLKEHRQ